MIKKIFLFIFSCGILAAAPFSITHSSPDNSYIACTEWEKLILHDFFRNLFSESPAGYVLFGEKPVYLCNPTDEKDVCIGTVAHHQCCELHEAIQIWKSLGVQDPGSNYAMLFTQQNLDPESLEYELLLINKPAFLKAVQNNLPLFQYMMGFHITPDSLLANLQKPHMNISRLFKGKTALLGIILGYGTENSIAYDRGTKIVKHSRDTQKRIPPFKQNTPCLNTSEYCGKGIEPAYPFHSINDEIDFLSQSLAHPTITDSGAIIGFSHIQNSRETKALLEAYEKAHISTKKMLDSPNFLDLILRRFNRELTTSPDTRDIFCDPQNIIKLPHLVAQSILEHITALELEKPSQEHFECFVNGMKKANETRSHLFAALEEYGDMDLLDSYQSQLTLIPQTRRNLTFARTFFSQLKTDSNIVCIEPEKIYYTIVQSGNGAAITKETDLISIHFEVRDIDNNVISATHALAEPQRVHISELIPGMILGIQGMKNGEIRDVYIHQEFAYGVYSDIGLGKPLIIRVALKDVSCDSTAHPLPERVPVDLLQLIGNKPFTKQQFEAMRRKYLEFSGFRTWLHLKKGQAFFTLDSILDEMAKQLEKSEIEPPLDANDKRMLRRLHLFLYSETHAEGLSSSMIGSLFHPVMHIT